MRPAPYRVRIGLDIIPYIRNGCLDVIEHRACGRFHRVQAVESEDLMLLHFVEVSVLMFDHAVLIVDFRLLQVVLASVFDIRPSGRERSLDVRPCSRGAGLNIIPRRRDGGFHVVPNSTCRRLDTVQVVRGSS